MSRARNVGAKYLPSFTAIALLLLVISCGKDPAPFDCRPSALQYSGDSVVFEYNISGRIDKVSYYDILRRRTKQDVFAYNDEGRLVIITKTVYPIASTSYVEVVHTLTYENGLPKELVSQSPFSSRIVTKFKHNEQGRLVEASTTSGDDFIGSTRYEYDEAGNIPKIFYTLDLNHQVTEVLARENFSFDSTVKFYDNIPELKICNEYVYAYLPTANHALSSKIYYYSYKQRFVSPLSVTFQPEYNDQGLITRLEIVESDTQFFSGDVLFQRLLYHCYYTED
ncbi:MAG TPA: hypothetical protein VFE50_00520 [Cyclobacteriaceae bacterium]|nr:hypothetical protein [Cyclobacteriaceae bacterium]